MCNCAYYNKSEKLGAAAYNISKIVKYSDERGAMIKFMVDEGYVPCSAAYLYRLIKQVEEKHLAIGGEWSRGCRNTEKAAQREKKDMRLYHREDPDDDVFPRQKVEPKMKLKLDPDRDGSRPNLCGKTGWKGTLVLPNLIPVSFGCDLDLFFKENRQKLSSGKELVFYGQARKHARNIDICSYIGTEIADEDICDYYYSNDRIFRLYFSPECHPPPKNVNDAGLSGVFAKLRDKIRQEEWISCHLQRQWKWWPGEGIHLRCKTQRIGKVPFSFHSPLG